MKRMEAELQREPRVKGVEGVEGAGGHSVEVGRSASRSVWMSEKRREEWFSCGSQIRAHSAAMA